MSSGGYWQLDKSLSQTNRHMLDTKLGADVCFHVGDRSQGGAEEMHAHKFMLVSRSPVFEAMFYGAMADESDVIEIPDVQPKAFRNLLEFMYTEDCTLIDEGTAIQTLYAAKKYMVSSLVTTCVQNIAGSIRADNACSLLQQCALLDEGQLVDRCRAFIQRHAGVIVNDVTLVSLSDATVKAILEDDKLMVLECDLLKGVIGWAEDCLDRREGESVTVESVKSKLDPFLPLIRFPLVPHKQLLKLNEKHHLLSASELQQIHQFQNGTVQAKELPFVSGIRGCKQSVRFKIMENFDASALVRKEERVKRKFALEFRTSSEPLTIFAVSLMCGPYLVKIAVFDPEGQLVSFTERDFSGWREKDCCREIAIVLSDVVQCDVSEECMRIEVYLSNSDVMYWYDNVIRGRQTESKHLKLKYMNPEIISKVHYLVG